VLPPGRVANEKSAAALDPILIDCYPAIGQTLYECYSAAMGGSQAFASRGYAVFFPVSRGPHVWRTVV
jgi:hypothetical protein